MRLWYFGRNSAIKHIGVIVIVILVCAFTSVIQLMQSPSRANRSFLLRAALSTMKDWPTNYQFNGSNTCSRYLYEGTMQRKFIAHVWPSPGPETLEGFNENEVTMLSQITLSRLAALLRGVEHWNGLVSVAVALSRKDLQKFESTFQNLLRLTKYKKIGLHLTLNEGTFYPVNWMRNLALNGSMTKYVFVLDADFMPKINMSKTVMKYISKLPIRSVLVIPVFEFLRENISFPNDKKTLFNLVKRTRVANIFHSNMAAAHRRTNYAKWYNAGAVYQVEYEERYEPFVVARREEIPPYEHRIHAPYNDKVSHLLNLRAMQFQFYVDPDHYAIHILHSRTRDHRDDVQRCATEVFSNFRFCLRLQHPHFS